ncbi:MAG TPA: ATP-binding protein [Oryzihumus sp.]|nr:ATP-binding protein [Oryzihumus sp.]
MAQRLRMLVAILCGLMLVIAGVAFAGLQEENGYVDRLTLSIGPALTSNADALQAMTDAESGLRGYASSRDLRFLEPYWGAHERAVADIATVRHSLQLDRAGGDDERDLLALVDQEAGALEAWWSYADQARLRAQQGQNIDLPHGKDLFDSFRVPNGQISDLVSSESLVLRTSARDQLTRNTAVLALITALALAVGLLLGNRVSRSVTRPLRNLRSVVRRQRAGDHEARAREDQGALEVRELAADFNALIAQNVSLSLAQAEALLMHELTREVARIVRAAPSADEAIEATCAALGKGLAVDRVLFHIIDSDRVVRHGHQWHRSGLADLPDLPEELLHHEVELAQEMWGSASSSALADFLDPRVQEVERAQLFSRATGARAVILAPVGLGERVLGVIALMMLDGPRPWSAPEVNAVQQSATFVARSIVQGEYDAHQAEHVERLERLDQQKTDFMATVSHELRTPLTSIAGYLELLRDGDVGSLSPQQASMLDIIERNAVRLRGLIEDLLVLNRIESTGLRAVVRPVGVGDLIKHVGDSLAPMADAAGVTLRIDPVPQEAVISADSAQVERALVNVVANAVKFTRSGGAVSVSVDLPEAGDDCEDATRVVRIRCRDTGIGIPADDLERLFVRFFRASNATSQAIPGTGLGLAIVKTIVEGHEGTLTLSSTEGEGTEVVIELPLARLPEPV